MKKYEPKQMVAISRYQNYFPSLPAKIQEDVYARISELIEEELLSSVDEKDCSLRLQEGFRKRMALYLAQG